MPPSQTQLNATKKNIEGYNLENKIDSVCIIMAEGILQTAPKPTPNLG
jgi:hypothetical protein